MKLTNKEIARYHYLMSCVRDNIRKKIEETVKETGVPSSRDMPKETFEKIEKENRVYTYNNGLLRQAGIPYTEPFNPKVPSPEAFNNKGTVRLHQFNTLAYPYRLPDRLVRADCWCNWTLTAKLGTGGAVKLQKIPTNTATGRFLKASDYDSLSRFDDALNMLKRGNVSGVSFVLTDKVKGIIGVDIDHCIRLEDGKEVISDLGLRALTSFRETYCELSPSGTGIRIFGIGKLPPKDKRFLKVECKEEGFPNQAIEVYDHHSSKPFTMTGAKFLHIGNQDGDMHKTCHSFLWLYYEFLAKPETIDESLSTEPLSARTTEAHASGDNYRAKGKGSRYDNNAPFTDDDILSIISKAKNATKFMDLYNGGLGGKPDASSADAAFCSMLAFYTESSRGGGKAQIDSIFRRSGRMRAKWGTVHYSDKRTYGEGVMDFATRNLRGTYAPR